MRQCKLCNASIERVYEYNGQPYGSTCIKLVLRKAGVKSNKKFGYLYNDAQSIMTMLDSEVTYYEARFSDKKNEAFRSMENARNVIGTSARKAINAIFYTKLYPGRSYRPLSDTRYWETYEIAKVLRDAGAFEELYSRMRTLRRKKAL